MDSKNVPQSFPENNPGNFSDRVFDSRTQERSLAWGEGTHFDRPNLTAAIRNAASQGFPTLVFGPRGSGVTTLLKSVAFISTAPQQGFMAYESMKGLTFPKAMLRIRKIESDYALSGMGNRAGARRYRCIVCFDDIDMYSPDENRKLADAFMQLIEIGCGVVVGATPDKTGFIDMFENPTVFEGRDLCFNLTEARKRSSYFTEIASYSYQFRTRGLIALTAAIHEDRECEQVGPSYEQQIDLLAMAGIEDCHDRPARKMIVASVLFSHGTFSELKEIGIPLNSESVRYIEACTPWAGVKASESSFRFAGGTCVPPMFLDAALGSYPGICRRVAAALVKRGDVLRAAEIARAMHRRRMDLDCLVPYVVEFYDAGAEDVAMGIVASAEKFGKDGRAKAQRQALELLQGRRDAPVAADRKALPNVTKSARRRISLLDMRISLLGRNDVGRKSRSSSVSYAATAKSCANRFDSKLAGHIEALSALIAGDPRRAASIYGTQHLDQSSGLIDVLRYAGYTIAVRMSGDGWRSDCETQRLAAVGQLEKLGFTEHARRVGVLFDLADEFFDEEFEPSRADSIRARVLAGDGTLERVLAELASAAADMERDRYLDAFMRAQKLLDGGFGEVPPAVAAAAHALACLAGACCSESPGPLRMNSGEFAAGAELYILDTVLWRLLFDQGTLEQKLLDGSLKTMVSSIEPTPLVMFVIRAAMRSKAVVADAVDSIIPASWRRAWPESFARVEDSASDDSFEDEPLFKTSPYLYIEVLGGLRVYRSGVLIPDRMWKRASALSLVYYLALARNHSARRVDIGRILWPEEDYYRMRDNMYACLTATRKVLGETASAAKCLETNIGRIAFNTMYVQVDKDRFELLAKQIVRRERGDQWVLRAGQRVEDLYKGGLAIPPNDPEGIFFAEKQRVDVYFVDAMVESARAAIRVGLYKEAVRFSRSALDVAPIREDVARVYMIALVRDGRVVEAKHCYEEFAALTKARSGRLPSFDLASILAEGGDNREYAS
jgi:DNA-binding SARP family transcriptional activator